MSAGMYLRVLRERQKLTRDQLVERVKTNSNESVKLSDVSLWSIEDGRQEPKGRLLFALIEALSASYEDISRLILDDSLTVDDARELAERRLSEERRAQVIDPIVSEFVNGFSPDELARVREELASDPSFLDTIARQVLKRRT